MLCYATRVVLDSLTQERFVPFLNQRLRIGSGASEVEAELVEARKLGVHRPGRREPFALTFRGPLHVVLPQRIHPVQIDGLGTLHLFLVPIGPDEHGMRYEAIFT